VKQWTKNHLQLNTPRVLLWGICLVSALSCNVLADESHDIIPASSSDTLPWVNVPSDYSPYFETCTDIDDGTGHFKAGVFKVVQIQEGMRYSFVNSGWDPTEVDHNNYYHIGTATYTITCGNKITYSASRYYEVYDHHCNVDFSDCSTPDGSLKTVDLSQLNTSSWTYNTLNQNTTLTIPVNDIFTTLNKHKITYPAYIFTGTPGKLARPVLLVHGLNDDFKVWGAKPVVNQIDDPSFRAAKVSGYLNGTLPDMLQRSQNLDVDYDHNGIYFYQAPGNWYADQNGKTSWLDALPNWSSDSATSQSRALYGRIKAVLDDYYVNTQGLDWTRIDSLQIDLVCHSQGGLVAREMLRGLASNTAFPTGTANAANHIRKIVTVDSPHFGSAVAGTVANAQAENFPGLAKIISDINTPTDHDLVDADIDLSSSDYLALVGAGAGAGGLLGGLPGALIGGIGTAIAADNISVHTKGPYLGPYSVSLDIAGDYTNLGHFDATAIRNLRNQLAAEDAQVAYLGPTSPFVGVLTQSGFPSRPNGTSVTTLPMYSDNTKAMVPMVMTQLGFGADQLCASGSSGPGCLSVGGILRNYANKYLGMDAISNISTSGELFSTLLSVQNDWLANSDVYVEASSQKMIDKPAGLDPAMQGGYFQTPRKYLIHDAQAPWEPVLHGPFSKSVDMSAVDMNSLDIDNPGAPRMGLDLLCALDESCGAALASSGASGALLRISSSTGSATVPAPGTTSGVRVATQVLALTGDFNVQPVYTAVGYRGVGLQNSDGSFRVVAGYQPGQGTYVWYVDDAGNAQYALLTPGDVMANVAIARQGNQVTVTATNYSGKTWTQTVALATLPANTTLAVLGAAGTTPAAMLAGTGTATDPSTQVAPTAPAGNMWTTPAIPTAAASSSPVLVYNRDARSAGESNTSRPRFLVQNISSQPINGFKVAYYFTGDPARNPMVEFDYPQANHTLENLGGDQWRFVIDASQTVLSAGSYFPSKDGWQIRLHYGDWTEWNDWRDYSADFSVGAAKLDAKIVVYAVDGSILWGTEPTLPVNQSSLTEAGTIQVSDAAPWETNDFKPQFTIKNTGTTSLSNYHALYYFNVPAGKSLQQPANNWSATDASLSVRSLGGNLWVLDVNFNKYILYPGQTIIEGNMGLNLVDWSAFDKTQVGLALTDANGNVIAGALVSSSSTGSSSSSSSVVTASQLQVSIEDQSDANYLKPRVKVLNQGSATVSAFDLSFRIMAENGEVPLFDAAWYVPSCSTGLSSLGNALYSVDLHCTGLSLAPGSVWPDAGGATFGVHYADWSTWDKSNDPSMSGVTSSGWTISTTTPITNVVSP